MPNNTSAQAASLPQVRPVWINSTVVLLELRRKFRNLRIFLLAILLPVMFFFMIAYPQRDSLEGSVNTGTYYMIGISAYAAIVSSSAVGAAIPIERVQGWSRALALTPFRPLGYVITKVLSSMLLGAIAVVVMMVLGLVTGMPLDAWQAAQSSLIIIAGSSAFAAFGIFVGYFMSADSAQTLINLIISVFSSFGGLLLPLSLFPQALQDIAHWLPSYGLGVLARLPVGVEWDPWALVNLVAWLVIFVAGAAWCLSKDTHRV